VIKETGEMLYTRQGCAGILSINRPGKCNALNGRCWDQLESVLQGMEAGSDPARVLVITGSGQEFFCAGVDVNPSDPLIAAMFQALQDKDAGGLKTCLARIRSLLSRLENLSIPTVAAFNGDAFSGGLELSLACDIRLAREGAFLAFQETRLGLIPDLGGTVRLSRLLGPGRAKDLVLSCRKITAGQALAMGLVQHVFPDGNFLEHVLDHAESLAANSPAALAAVKEIVNAAGSLPLDQALELELDLAARTILSGQCIEGVGAFFEKRPPRWRREGEGLRGSQGR
jgi:enoyl-CoA hydratase/carnithine racemase